MLVFTPLWILNFLQLVREIPWGHNITIMTKIKDPQEQAFYIRSTIDMKWSRSVLFIWVSICKRDLSFSKNYDWS